LALRSLEGWLALRSLEGWLALRSLEGWLDAFRVAVQFESYLLAISAI